MRLKLTRKKVIISSVLIILLSCTIFLYKFMWGKPFTVDQLYLRTFAKVMLSDPELMTTLGIINNSTLNFYNDDLTDVCPENEKKKYDIFKNDLETLSKYDRNKMSDEEKLSYDIFEWYLRMKSEENSLNIITTQSTSLTAFRMSYQTSWYQIIL